MTTVVAPTDSMTIGQRIRFYREQAGLSRRQLAWESGYSVHLVQKVEQGWKRATDQFVEAIAPILLVTVDTLTGGSS